MDVFKFMEQCTSQFNFIFAGPPYALRNIDDLPKYVFEKNLLLPYGIFVLEHTPRNQYEDHAHFYRVKNYGTTVFTFFQQNSNQD
jgi:16S rRNA G966 N2-methylase RsmD